MTGPEHYREAERLAERAQHFTNGDGDGVDPVVGQALATEAQVHATLALAAATAAQLLDPGDVDDARSRADLAEGWKKAGALDV